MALKQPSQQGEVIEAEQAVIGSMLTDPECVSHVLGKVDPKDFAMEQNRQLFLGARILYTAGKSVDPLTILAAIGKNDDKEMRQYAAELMEVTPTSANVDEYIEIMHEQAQLRAIRSVAMVLQTAPTLAECSSPIRELEEVFGAGQKLDAIELFDMLADFARRKGMEKPEAYIPLGFREIDENTFLELGDVLVIGGAPSDGKTALAIKIAFALSALFNVGFYSLETNFKKITDRLVASSYHIDFNAIKKSQLTDADWMAFNDGVEEAPKRHLTVLHASGLTVDQITSSARAHDFNVVIIDYVQLIRPTETRNVPRHDQIAQISQALHTFAQATGTLVIELAQLARKERQTKREYDMFDLGESSQLEKDADIVLLLYRPPKGTHFIEGDKNSELLDPDRTRILRIAKQKEGKRVRLPLVFAGEYQDFAVMSENAFSAIRRQAREAKKSSVSDGGVQEFIALPKSAEEDMPF